LPEEGAVDLLSNSDTIRLVHTLRHLHTAYMRGDILKVADIGESGKDLERAMGRGIK
jgi:hypothetical protein